MFNFRLLRVCLLVGGILFFKIMFFLLNKVFFFYIISEYKGYDVFKNVVFRVCI